MNAAALPARSAFRVQYGQESPKIPWFEGLQMDAMEDNRFGIPGLPKEWDMLSGGK